MELNSNIIDNIEEYCFACLQIKESVVDISNKDEILQSFKNTFNLEIEKIVESSKNLCNICLSKLNDAQEFYNQINASVQCFNEYIKTRDEYIKTRDAKKDIPEVKLEEDKLEEIENEQDEKPDYYSDSESDYEPLSRLVKKSARFNAKLKKVPLKLVEETIEEYRKRCKENSNCIICDFKGISIRNLSSHMIHKHKGENIKWCSRCNMLFENMDSHRKTHSNKTWCKFCNKNVTRCHYLEHLKNHAELQYSCEECQKKFISKKALEEHKAQHYQNKPFQCPNCPKAFKLIKNLEDHISLHGRYTCLECNKHFEIPELLSSHLCTNSANKKCSIEELQSEISNNNENANEQNEILPKVEENFDDTEKAFTTSLELKKVEDLICHFCQKTYKTAYKLQKHIEGHMGIYSATCRFCGKGFYSNSDLINHERVHTKEKPFICNVCGKGFVSGATLRIHLKQHTGKPEQCELCLKRFCRKSELKLHLQKHRGERPFLCTECGKSFAQKSHLTCHLTMHSDERPFACTLCEKSFKKKGLLKHHMKLHGEKKFKCHLCYYECHKNYRLQQHMKLHEGKMELKAKICQLCNKGFSTLSLMNNHMSNIHNVII